MKTMTMKTLLPIALLFIAVGASGQGTLIVRSNFTTNAAPASITATTINADSFNVGTLTVTNGIPRELPQNSKSAAYTTVLTDSGKHIYHPSADTTARTWTIDSNANVAYPIGTQLIFVNDTSGGVITVAITSDTLLHAADGSTGNYTLAASKIATAMKITSTRWIISP